MEGAGVMDKYQNKTTHGFKILIIKPSKTFIKLLAFPTLLDWAKIHHVHHIPKNFHKDPLFIYFVWVWGWGEGDVVIVYTIQCA